MTKTKIEWADRVWNPVTGCTKVSEGCRHCYAETMAKRFWKDRKFSDVQCHPDRLIQPMSWKKPSRVFVNSMSDLFHPDVPFDFIDQVFAVMQKSICHKFMILTKRPEQMKAYYDHLEGENRFRYLESAYRWLEMDPPVVTMFPFSNIWLGVSVENQKAADERIPLLLKTPAAVRFLSCEPLLGPVDLWKFATREETFGSMYDHRGSYPFYQHLAFENKPMKYHEGIDWVIVGGESGSSARPMHPDWARSIRDQCDEAGVSFFFKQWGEWVPFEQVEFDSKEKIGIQIGDQSMVKVGKKNAGRLLDGREWNDFPEVK